MSNVNSEGVIKLIKALTKAEKRSFKLYATRNSSSSEDLKFLQLFDFIEKVDHYSDELALKRLPQLKKAQLSNLKAHLYKQVLTSLRLQHLARRPDSEVRELIDHAQILYQKGFYLQALRMLDKAKENARRLNADILTLAIVQFEKIIESQYITRSMDTRADELCNESIVLENRISGAIMYSNIALQLYSLYLKVGFVRDEKDYLFVKNFFYSKLPEVIPSDLSIEEKLHLYNAFVRYNHIIQDFVMSYRYARLWVDLFESAPSMIEQNKELYVKGLHNLLLSLFNLRSYKRFVAALEHFKHQVLHERDSENVQLLYKQYWYTNEINRCYLEGNFEEGLVWIPKIEAFIVQSRDKLDTHRILVFYYKIACLYFGIGNYRSAIQYLNIIIHQFEQEIREDIQAFSRILNLIAHFELGNDDLVAYQIKSVYRYLSKIKNLQGVQREILNFLRHLPILDPVELRRAFKQLHNKLVKLSLDRYEKRPFLYLDIISWLESKLENRTVQEVIRAKFEEEVKTGVKMYFPSHRQSVD